MARCYTRVKQRANRALHARLLALIAGNQAALRSLSRPRRDLSNIAAGTRVIAGCGARVGR